MIVPLQRELGKMIKGLEDKNKKRMATLSKS
jgi:hypothetical protein